ncbi:DUF499 domain-containing protein [Streptomyces sp. WMMC1477]|uniref:DUF499 domain-containing protein n=1 Tax=Streptomyces sp. WMMC1477 TaxID=3015155 RepID=UPI0022B73BE9|nr:DUF499 domain-containing protein [Streptomyces sp. WMMC1477]MCZ7434511.1 DUF499 domain-containing protein [Streptomyces sp. WMMC1477]
MSTGTAAHWADLLTLRPEVTDSDGSVGELQMSLHKAVYQTVDVPYRKVDYYSDITQPTPNLVGFFGRIARRLGTDADRAALFHLDQGMGGGKSHALVGLYHMAHSPQEFFATELGRRVRDEAEQGGADVDLADARTVVLTADYFSPGRTSEIFGPATNLFERFLWSLTGGDMDRYQRYVNGGPNKDTLQQALTDVGRPVLILLDELMDYVLQLAEPANIASMPGEQAFLNALMDVCDDVPRVALVVVMIRSELDERGYPPQAEAFRSYVSERLVRNGPDGRVAVTESHDFTAIIRRRLFESADVSAAAAQTAQQYAAAHQEGWQEKVLDRIGPGRGTAGFAERVAVSYPFHPELMRLVREEWSRVQNFQRVRSTVAIFARTALYWVTEHQAGRWAPALIGVGDIPLTTALEQLLSSGLFMNNDRAVQGYRSVATTDITSSDGSAGRAVTIDRRLRAEGVTAGQQHPAVRMATALFCYSMVARPRTGRGAVKAELLAAILEPAPALGTPYTEAEEIFNALTGEDGLGALEITQPANAPARYYLSIKQTLRMYYTACHALVDQQACEKLLWDKAQKLAHKGTFDEIHFIDAPAATGTIDLARTFEGVDSATTRLVVLDLRRWTLLNGKDTRSRAEITALFGLGPDALRVDNAASCTVACVNTQRRDVARKRAKEVLAWRNVLKQIDPEDVDEYREATAKTAEAEDKLKKDIEKAFQHYAYLVRAADGLHVEFKRFDGDGASSLREDQVWSALVEAGRATTSGGLSAEYLATLLDTFERTLTPREVVQFFYKNPSFPLVPSTDDIRRAVFALLHEGWELVDSDGNPLAIASDGQISINSISQSLRRAVEAPEAVSAAAAARSFTTATLPQQRDVPVGWQEGALPADSDDQQYRSTAGQTGGIDAAGAASGAPSAASEPVAFKRYIIELTNRSITASDARSQAWELLKELSKVIDSDADHQLLTLNVTLVTAEGAQGSIQQKAEQAGARFRIEDDDF